jgi:hypothetical protein
MTGRTEADRLREAIHSACDAFRGVDWGSDGDCGAGRIMDALEAALEVQTEPEGADMDYQGIRFETGTKLPEDKVAYYPKGTPDLLRVTDYARALNAGDLAGLIEGRGILRDEESIADCKVVWVPIRPHDRESIKAGAAALSERTGSKLAACALYQLAIINMAKALTALGLSRSAEDAIDNMIERTTKKGKCKSE